MNWAVCKAVGRHGDYGTMKKIALLFRKLISWPQLTVFFFPKIF